MMSDQRGHYRKGYRKIFINHSRTCQMCEWRREIRRWEDQEKIEGVDEPLRGEHKRFDYITSLMLIILFIVVIIMVSLWTDQSIR